MTPVGPLEIRDAVRRTFDRVAEAPRAGYRFEVGPDLARAVGYPEALLAGLPPSAVEAFTGLAYLHPWLRPAPGERVLDLGAGAGLDTVLLARAVRPGGQAVGLDFSERMVARARALADRVGAPNVRVERGEAEALPFADAAFDAAHVNGLLNLCPDKAPVARELRRVVRPGGRAVVAEITFGEPLAARELRSVDDWFR
jgi:SAM-dependent methyltransferase